MLLSKRLLYSPSEEALDNVENEIDNTQFGNFKTRIDSYWTRRKEWALCFRTKFPTRGNFTNNYSEASIRITKDILFQRRKAWNSIQLFQLITKTLDLYHQRRLLSYASNRLDHFVSLRFTLAGIKPGAISFDNAMPTDDSHVYVVQSQSNDDI